MARKVLGFEIQVENKQLTETKRELISTEAQIKKLRKSTKDNEGAQKASAGTLTRLEARQKALRQEYSKQQRAILLNTQAVKGQAGSYNQLAAQTSILKAQLKALPNAFDKTNQKANELKRQIAQNTAQLKKFDQGIGDNFRNVGNYRSALTGVRDNFLKVTAAIGGAILIFRQFTSVTSRAIDAFGEQERTQKQLEVALGRTSQALLNQATALQRVSKFGDESIVQAQAFLAQMGLTEREILKITPLVLDLAEAQGLGLEESGKLLAKSLGSSTNALKRYGVDIEGAVGSQERLDSAINSLTTAFGGQAEAAAKVGTGPLTQLRNRIDDLSEELGEKLLPIQIKITEAQLKWSRVLTQVLPTIIRLAPAILAIVGGLAAYRIAMALAATATTLFGKALKTIPFVRIATVLGTIASFLLPKLGNSATRTKGAMEKFNEELERTAEEAKTAEKELTKLDNRMAQFSDEFERFTDKQLIDRLKQINEQIKIFSGQTFNAITGQVEDDPASQAAVERLQAQADRINEILSARFVRADGVETLATLKNEVSELQDELENLDVTSQKFRQTQAKIEALQKRIAELTKDSADSTKDLGKELEALDLVLPRSAQIDESVQKLQEFKDALDELFKTAKQGFPPELAADFKNFATAFAETIDEDFSPDADDRTLFEKIFKLPLGGGGVGLENDQQVQEFRDNLRQLGEVFSRDITASFFQARQRSLDKELELRVKSIEDERDAVLRNENLTEQQRLAINKKFELQRESAERDAAVKRQNVAITEAIINGALAAVSALSRTTLPFPLSLTALAPIAALTAAQIGVIKSQKFAKGGIIDGKSHARGGEPVYVGGQYMGEAEGGEMLAIVNKRSTGMIGQLSAINEMGGGVPFGVGGSKVKFQSGGLIPAPSTSNIVGDIVNGIRAGLQDQRIINVATDTASVANKVTNIQSSVRF